MGATFRGSKQAAAFHVYNISIATCCFSFQGISSKLPGLQATLAELVAEADGIEIGGFLEEQLQSAQDRQRTLCQLVTGPPVCTGVSEFL